MDELNYSKKIMGDVEVDNDVFLNLKKTEKKLSIKLKLQKKLRKII